MDKEIQILRDLYAALNRNDIPAALKHADPEISRIEWEGTPSEGSFRGIEEVKAHFQQGRDTWAEGSCTPEKFQVAGSHVIVSVKVRVKLKKNQEWVEGRVADVFTFRNERIIRFQSFFDEQQAIKWAGLQR